MNYWDYKTNSSAGARVVAGILVVVSLWVGLWAPPAWAAGVHFPGRDIEAQTTLHRGGSLSDGFDPSDASSLEYLRQVHEDPLMLIDEMIATENWEAWQIFQASPGLGIPLIAAQFYIVYSAEADRMSKRPKVQERRYLPKESRVSDQQWFEEQKQRERQPQQRAYIVQERSVQQGLLKMDTRSPRTATSGFRPLNWLFEEEGVFSGRAWNWENFIPRVLTVAGLVLAVLMVIEFLHLVVAAGMRTLGRRDQRAGH
ncbi:MAG: hypothetical protein HY794_15005 [Desulfarculus sp.]|nr:hypothetical protein [Desulfarculus sp.]